MQFDPLSRGTRLFGAATFLFGSSDNELILEALPARVAVVDSLGRIRAVNAAWRGIADGGDFFTQAFDRGLNYLDLCDSTLGTNARAAWVIASGLRSVLDGSSPSFQTSYSWQFAHERRPFKCLISPVGGDGSGLRGAIVMHVDLDTDVPDTAETPRRFDLAAFPGLSIADRLDLLTPSEAARGVGLVADAVPALVAYLDSDLTYRAANRWHQEWFGVPAGDIVGMSLPDVVGQALFHRLEPHAATVLSGTEVTFDDVFEPRPGHSRWFRASFIPDADKDGRVRGFSVLAHDITVQRAQAQQLEEARTSAEQANRAQSDVLANVGSELRNPLTSIVGFAETLAAQLFGPISDQYRDYARDIRDTACGLVDLVNDLTDLSLLQSGQLQLDELRIDMRTLLTSGLGRVEQEARAAGVKLKLAVPRKVPTVFADERLVRQVILNTVLTAVRHASDGGTVTVSVRRDSDGALAVVVGDDDLTMTQGDLDRLLEPFARVEVPRTPAAIGGGLALPLAKHFMQIHGGSLTLTAKAKHGVSATATFPRARVVD